ncbi:DUF3151 family protein [Agromyces sp. MMS24-K17]|uniref:DUF3151 family protein n=1 Tax=Agromyces sp. MMS24-K17 TaxID=3372850 RepID=UPI003754018D
MTADETSPEPEASLVDEPEVRQALADGDRGTVHDVVAEHPSSPLAWTELADVADSTGRPVEAFAYATVAVDLAREQLAAAGWTPGHAVSWADEPNRAYLRGLDAKRRAALALGLDDAATAAGDELAAADEEAPARIASEFTPTQQLSLADVRAALADTGEQAAPGETSAIIGDPVAAPDAAAAAGED